MAESEAWVDGFELMRMLDADYYHVQHKGFWPGGDLKGQAVYKRGDEVLAELDAIEPCGWDWRGNRTWMVRPPQNGIEK